MLYQESTRNSLSTQKALVMFVINNFYFQTNLSGHSINTRQQNFLHKTLTNLSSIQKGTTYLAIKFFNKQPLHVKKLQHDNVQFKNALKHYLRVPTFYSCEDFLSH